MDGNLKKFCGKEKEEKKTKSRTQMESPDIINRYQEKKEACESMKQKINQQSGDKWN